MTAAISCATDPNHWNVVGPGVDWIAPGSWLHLDQGQVDYINETQRKEDRRDFLAQKIAISDTGLQIRVLTRPLASDLAPPHDQFAKVMANWKKHKSLKECCRFAKPVPIPQDPQAVLDRMLLVLWDALHLDQCLRWSAQKVCNLPVDHSLELGRWFSMGLAVSKDALFSGMCAMCRQLSSAVPLWLRTIRSHCRGRSCVGQAPTCCTATPAKSRTVRAGRPSISRGKLYGLQRGRPTLMLSPRVS